MRLSPLALQIAFVALAASAAHAADTPRGQRGTSAAQRATVSAPAARPRPVPQPPRNYERPQSQERRATATSSAPTSVQFRDKPAYQFTQVAPRSLW
jgi:hypothetical protein